MNRLQIFLLTILMLLLAFITGVISLYAINPEFASFMRDQIENMTAEATEAAIEEEEDTGVKDGGEAEKSDPELKERAADRSADTEGEEGIAEEVRDQYIAPEEDSLQIPGDLSEKSGYEKISFTEETVTDEEADRIEEELSTEPTGDDLQFDPDIYPYYAMLDERGQRLYRQIYANFLELNPAFKSVDRLMSGRRIDSAFEAVFNDHPELFFVDTEYRAVYRKNGDFIEMDLFYNDTAGKIEEARSEFETAANRIISGASGSDYEKEKYVHGKLTELFTYQRNPLDQSAYSGLVLNRTVCAGYARSFSYIMSRLGVPCYLCTGYAGEAHGWNIIRLDGEYYNVDVTWDDNETGRESFEWFNKTDEDYGRTHIRKSLSVYLPPCNGTRYRNLEPEEEEDPEGNLLSLEDTGFSTEDVIHDIQSYYDELYGITEGMGQGSYSFSLVIGEEIMDECDEAYKNNELKNRVLERIAAETGFSAANLRCDAKKLKGGYYLLEHTLTIR